MANATYNKAIDYFGLETASSNAFSASTPNM